MKAKKKKETAASIRLLSIVKALSGIDPAKTTREREYVNARMVMTKILRDNELWTFAQIGSLFNLDHATMRHAYYKFDVISVQDKSLLNLYTKALKMYVDKTVVDNQIYNEKLSAKLLEKDNTITILQAQLIELRAELEAHRLQQIDYKDIFTLIRKKVPLSKKEVASKKINTILNGI
jgi:hypothetical protein